jgi:hypothetical protein
MADSWNEVWKGRRHSQHNLIGTVGDVNYETEGGGEVYDDGTMYYFSFPFDETRDHWKQIRAWIKLDPIKKDEWYDLDGVASFCGCTVEDLLSHNNDILELANIYLDLLAYYSVACFDSDYEVVKHSMWEDDEFEEDENE